MKHQVVTAILMAALPLVACVPGTHLTNQSSHVDANVPAQDEFHALLQRDLLAYFSTITRMRVTTVDATLLRNEATQSGVSNPKYYAWVEIHSDSQDAMSGAVRVAAIDQKRFEVTDFLSREALRSDPDAAAAVFPAALLEVIRTRAYR
jgi:hypothetical protein